MSPEVKVVPEPFILLSYSILLDENLQVSILMLLNQLIEEIIH
jgi:hypothetical protein